MRIHTAYLQTVVRTGIIWQGMDSVRGGNDANSAHLHYLVFGFMNYVHFTNVVIKAGYAGSLVVLEALCCRG